MTDDGNKRERPIETGGENAATSDALDEAITGGEDADPTKGTSKIGGEGQVAGQTQTPADDDDVGVPDDLDERTE